MKNDWTNGLLAASPDQATEGIVGDPDRLRRPAHPRQTFTIGSDRHYPEEGPAHRVAVDGFAIERHPVTNAQFAAFVRDTGYVTVAERPLDPADFPGAPPENLLPGSMVFTPTAGPVDLRHLEPVVDLDARRALAAPRGAPARRWPAGRPPRRPRGPRGRRGLRRLGGPGAADRGRVGGRRARRARRRRLHLGRRPRGEPGHGWRTTGTARSPGAPTPATAPTSPVGRSPPTPTACSTWPATSGSGRRTGTPSGTPHDGLVLRAEQSARARPSSELRPRAAAVPRCPAR